jgi:hypothetical protein
MRFVWLLILLIAATSPSLSQHHNSGSGRHDVHVRGHTRKDGTVVHSHDRAAPGYGTKKSSSGPSHNHHSSSWSSHSSGNPHKRSRAARDAFERQHPCPSTGKSSGRCPGYVVDHVKALKCGGADEPSNMQWQTVESAKVKDKAERAGCR